MIVTILHFEIYCGGFSKYEDIKWILGPSPKEICSLLSPHWATVFCCLWSWGGEGVTCVCLTGSPCLWGLRISLKLMGASRFLPRWGHCWAPCPALLSSCRELGNGGLYNPSPPHLQELPFSIWSSYSCQGEKGTWHLRQIVKFPHSPLFTPPNRSRLAHTPSNCLY